MINLPMHIISWRPQDREQDPRAPRLAQYLFILHVWWVCWRKKKFWSDKLGVQLYTIHMIYSVKSKLWFVYQIVIIFTKRCKDFLNLWIIQVFCHKLWIHTSILEYIMVYKFKISVSFGLLLYISREYYVLFWMFY